MGEEGEDSNKNVFLNKLSISHGPGPCPFTFCIVKADRTSSFAVYLVLLPGLVLNLIQNSALENTLIPLNSYFSLSWLSFSPNFTATMAITSHLDPPTCSLSNFGSF